MKCTIINPQIALDIAEEIAMLQKDVTNIKSDINRVQIAVTNVHNTVESLTD